MSKATLFNLNLESPAQIHAELYEDVGADTFQLGTYKRAFYDVQIYHGADSDDTLLQLDIDYTLEDEDTYYTDMAGFAIYTGIKIINATYQVGDLFISYKCIGTYTDKDSYSAIEAAVVAAVGKVPVGAWYTQYPSEESNTKTTAFPTADEPAELFGGTWVQYYEDEGLFFKTEGDPLSQTDGENNARTDGVQTDAFQGHYHNSAYYYNIGGGATAHVLAATTAALLIEPPNFISVTGVTTDATYGTKRISKETRPRNRLVKIWRRTA